MVDIRSENTMSPSYQCCQRGIMFKNFKWHYVMLFSILHFLVMIIYVKHTSQ